MSVNLSVHHTATHRRHFAVGCLALGRYRRQEFSTNAFRSCYHSAGGLHGRLMLLHSCMCTASSSNSSSMPSASFQIVHQLSNSPLPPVLLVLWMMPISSRRPRRHPVLFAAFYSRKITPSTYIGCGDVIYYRITMPFCGYRKHCRYVRFNIDRRRMFLSSSKQQARQNTFSWHNVYLQHGSDNNERRKYLHMTSESHFSVVGLHSAVSSYTSFLEMIISKLTKQIAVLRFHLYILMYVLINKYFKRLTDWNRYRWIYQYFRNEVYKVFNMSSHVDFIEFHINELI